MATNKYVTVTVVKSRHQSQPFSFTIDKPGAASDETKKERYTRKATAERGALRMLNAYENSEADRYLYKWCCDVKGKKCKVAFVFVDKTRKK